jgi:putative peptidoglycan lipid II flippase
MFTVLVLLVSIVTIAGIALAPLVVQLFICDRVETALLTQIMFPYLALVAMAALLQGVLNSVGVFTPTGVAPILFNACFIIVPFIIVPFAPNPARAMAIGVVVGGIAQALCQLPAIIRGGFRFGFIGIRRAFRNKGVHRVLTLIAPTILGMAAYQLNDLVCTVVASHVGPGVATSLTFSLRLQELFLGVFAVSMGTVLLPDLTDHVHKKNWGLFSDRLKKALQAIALITIPVSVFSMAEGRDIVVLLFKSNEFTDLSANMTTAAFFFHMSGLFFIAVNRILAPAFYACGDTKNPTWAGIASFTINIVLAILLSIPMQGGGIALALSISSCFNFIVLAVMLLRKRMTGIRNALSATVLYAVKMLAFSIVAVIPIVFAGPALRQMFSGSNRFLSAGVPLAATGLCFGIIGIALLVVFRDPIAKGLVSSLTRKKR